MSNTVERFETLKTNNNNKKPTQTTNSASVCKCMLLTSRIMHAHHHHMCVKVLHCPINAHLHFFLSSSSISYIWDFMKQIIIVFHIRPSRIVRAPRQFQLEDATQITNRFRIWIVLIVHLLVNKVANNKLEIR